MHPLDKFKYCPICGADNFTENDDKSKKCHKCGFRYYLNAVSAVAGFIVDDNNRLLLCRRAKEPLKGTLDLPGGFVDIGETAEDAIRREVKEELNLHTDSIRYLFSIPNEYLYSGFNVRTLDMFFMIKISDMSTLTAKDDVAQAMFIPFDQININSIGLKSIKIAVEKFLASRV
jgi:MutT/NUDIX family protein